MGDTIQNLLSVGRSGIPVTMPPGKYPAHGARNVTERDFPCMQSWHRRIDCSAVDRYACLHSSLAPYTAWPRG